MTSLHCSSLLSFKDACYGRRGLFTSVYLACTYSFKKKSQWVWKTGCIPVESHTYRHLSLKFKCTGSDLMAPSSQGFCKWAFTHDVSLSCVFLSLFKGFIYLFEKQSVWRGREDLKLTLHGAQSPTRASIPPLGDHESSRNQEVWQINWATQTPHINKKI